MGREYKNQRAIINKQVDKQKQEYITNKLNNSENRWKTLNDINNKSTFASPRSIIHKDAITTNIQEICNIANNYYINSIKTLRERIPQTTVTPIDILKKIYKRQQSTLEIPIPTIPQIAQIIKKAKSTNSVGHDNISMKMIKKTTTIMAPLITHLIKQIIIERKFPSIFKTDRITPKLKNGKPIYDIASYRPLNNLCTIEKIIEEYIINHLEPFLTKNKIIHDNHHGGRKGHSTTTALNQILTKFLTAKENQQITGCLITDLSKAFDTIDHLTLLMKMEYYGIRGPELEIFKSYLSNRQQFVEIDTYRSKIRASNPCSVIQGSKLSGILYTLYTNEIPQLYTLMQDNIYTEIPGMPTINTKGIEHHTVNYVDDSTNLIITKDPTKLQTYLNAFYILLQKVYNTNKLIINQQKTELMLICNNRNRKITRGIQMYAGKYRVKQVDTVKVLGYKIQSNLHNDAQVNKTIADINHRIFSMKKLGNKTKFETRQTLAKAIIIGKLNYTLPLHANSTKLQLQKLNTLITKTCKAIIGNPCNRWNTIKMVTKCKLRTVYQLINEQGLYYIHKIQATRTPASIYNLYNVNDNTRPKLNLRPIYNPKSIRLLNSLFYKYTELYIDVPEQTKNIQLIKF